MSVCFQHTHTQTHTHTHTLLCVLSTWCGSCVFICTRGKHVARKRTTERLMWAQEQHSVTSARPHRAVTLSVTSSIQCSQVAHSPPPEHPWTLSSFTEEEEVVARRWLWKKFSYNWESWLAPVLVRLCNTCTQVI